MMTSSNDTIFRVDAICAGEFTSHQWIPLKKASNAEILYFLWYTPGKTVD